MSSIWYEGLDMGTVPDTETRTVRVSPCRSVQVRVSVSISGIPGLLIFLLIAGGVGGCVRQQTAQHPPALAAAQQEKPIHPPLTPPSVTPVVPPPSPMASGEGESGGDSDSPPMKPSLHSSAPQPAPAPSAQPESPETVPTPSVPRGFSRSPELIALQEKMAQRYAGRQPASWGDRLPGITRHLASREHCLALTFDACGYGKKSQGYDAALIAFLRQQQVPATLFVSGLWADAHPDLVSSLAADPLFEIENHGLRHLPCSISGHAAYRIPGTRDAADVVLEVEGNAEKLAALTGRKPRFYRAGTAFYDDVALAIVADLGDTVVGYSVLGDAGATYSAAQVKAALLSAKPGDIVLCHMNHPEGETCAGIEAVIPLLKARGFTFVTLEEGMRVSDQ